MTTPPTDNPDILARIVMLVFGKMQDNAGSYWCYVAIRPSKYNVFMDLHRAGKVNLYDFEREGYGEIIVSGQGRTPPSEITYQVAQVYRLNLNELYKESDAETLVNNKILQFRQSLNT